MDDLKYQIHNCHTHLFTVDHIPKYFLHAIIPVSIARKKWLSAATKFLFEKQDQRIYAFLFAAGKASQEEIYEELKGYYTKSAKYAVLSIDFDYMGAGKPKKGFLEQLDELDQLSQKVNREREQIFPFIGVDPRREGVFDLVKRYIEERGFKGIKIYPALGFFPNDKRLYDVYEYAERLQIPITTHCIPKNKNHFRFKITDEWRKKASAVPGYDPKEARKAYDFAQYLLHPHWYEQLLKDFPKLKINFGHFGGNTEWDKYLDIPAESTSKNRNWYSLIRNLLKTYEHTYADISFTVQDQSLYPLLKNVILSTYHSTSKYYSLQEKVLFGTDFYMLQKNYNERRFGLDVRGYLSDDLYWQIAETNPKRFLSNKV